MRPYEMTIVLTPSLEDDEAVDGQLSRFVKILEDNGAKLENVDKWGKRKLAYEVNGNTEGYYTVMHFDSDKEAAAELSRILKLSDSVIRYLLVRRDEE